LKRRDDMLGREPVLWMGLIQGVMVLAVELGAGDYLTPRVQAAVTGLAVALIGFITRMTVTPNQSVALRVDGKPA
jgi:hypothetical protein